MQAFCRSQAASATRVIVSSIVKIARRSRRLQSLRDFSFCKMKPESLTKTRPSGFSVSAKDKIQARQSLSNEIASDACCLWC